MTPIHQSSFGTCAICGQGQLFAAIDADSDRLLLVCDDCGSQWLSPSDARSYQKALMSEARHLQPAGEQALAAAGWLECADAAAKGGG